jgi:hypothetical protein
MNAAQLDSVLTPPPGGRGIRIIGGRTLPALLMLALLPACASLGTEARPDGLSGRWASGATPAKAPAAPTTQDPSVDPTQAGGSSDDGWSFLVKPYLFAYGMEGTLGSGRRSTDVDADFDDLFDALSFGGMLVLEAGIPDSDWTLLTDLQYVRLEDDGLTRGPVGLAAEAEIEQFIGELAAAYELIDEGRLEVLGGVRYWHTSIELELALPGGPQHVGGDEDWFDPLVGLRSRLELGGRFDLYLRGDIGGFGLGSDLAYNLAAEVGWALSDTFQVAVGYRYLDVDYADGVTYDMTQAGPTIGLAIRF